MTKRNCKNCNYLGSKTLRPFIKDSHWCRFHKKIIILNPEDSDCEDFEEAKDE